VDEINFLRGGRRAKERVLSEGLERKSAQVCAQQTLVLSGMAWAIIHVHGVREDGEISRKNEGYEPGEPWLRGWRVKIWCRRWGWPSFEGSTLNVTRRWRPLPHRYQWGRRAELVNTAPTPIRGGDQRCVINAHQLFERDK
jgi:hypothetical protein